MKTYPLPRLCNREYSASSFRFVIAFPYGLSVSRLCSGTVRTTGNLPCSVRAHSLSSQYKSNRGVGTPPIRFSFSHITFKPAARRFSLFAQRFASSLPRPTLFFFSPLIISLSWIHVPWRFARARAHQTYIYLLYYLDARGDGPEAPLPGGLRELLHIQGMVARTHAPQRRRCHRSVTTPALYRPRDR